VDARLAAVVSLRPLVGCVVGARHLVSLPRSRFHVDRGGRVAKMHAGGRANVPGERWFISRLVS
jgi:hypothetical protein